MNKPRFLFPHKIIRAIGLFLSAAGLLTIGTAFQFHDFANGLDAVVFYTGWMEVYCYNALYIGIVVGIFGVISGMKFAGSSRNSVYTAPLATSLLAVYGSLLYRAIKESEGFFTTLNIGTVAPNFWFAFSSFILVLLSSKSAAFYIIEEEILTASTEAK